MGWILFVLKKKVGESMITLREEHIQSLPQLFVEKRDGRKVKFDVDKIYRALVKATEEVTGLTPALEAKLETVTDRIVAEILERFPRGVKIYEIQNVVEHELLQANEYAIAESYITYRTQRDLSAQRQRISTLPSASSSTRTKLSLMKMPIRTAMFLIPSAIWQQELSASLLV